MSESLVVPAFGGGVVLAAQAEALDLGELQECDGFDIAPRGQLQSARTPLAFIVVNDLAGVPAPLARVFGMAGVRFGNANAQAVVVGMGKDAAAVDRYFFGQIGLETGLASQSNVEQTVVVAPAFAPPVRVWLAINYTQDPIVTFAPFPYVNAAGLQLRLLFINLGARFPMLGANEMPGLYVMVWDGAAYQYYRIDQYDSLGTGPRGEFIGGTLSKPLYFRGIAAYNNFIFGWGFDNADAGNKDSPARLMFSNLGNPLKWGNDNIAAAGADRAFTDSDAINVGSAGEVITAAVASKGKLWIGTNRGLHYLSGYGRDSFLTDGTTGVAGSLAVVGANALIEGPDGDLYGVSPKGLWAYRSGAIDPIYEKLVKFDGTSPGYWDLWGGVFPLRTGSGNIDRTWLRSDVKRHQVWCVIPFVDAVSGAGAGNDTVIIKYHVLTGGFTRQVLLGVIWLPGTDMSKGTTIADHVFVPQYGSAQTVVDFISDVPPASQKLTAGEYAPFGPNGVGVCRVAYLTLAWAAAALPIAIVVTPHVDGQALAAVALTLGAVAPVAPADGDLWLDTSGTDANLGNATAGAIVASSGDYLFKRWMASWAKWIVVSRARGMKGTRATLPIAFTPTEGTRVKLQLSVTAAAARISLESLGILPKKVRGAA